MSSTILVVDDSEVVLTVTKSMLEEAGYRVVTLAKATGLVSLILAERPALVLLDVNMPALSGDTIARICARTARTTGTLVALHSSLDDTSLERLVRESGANTYIRKTGNSYAFLRQVRDLIGSACKLPSTELKSATVRVAEQLAPNQTPEVDVLLVERDMSLLGQMRDIMREIGARSEFALSITQALDKLPKRTPPTVLVVAADLPDDGLRRLLEGYRTAYGGLTHRIVILSSPETAQAVPSDFPGAVVAKPFAPASLKQRIQRLLEEQQQPPLEGNALAGRS